MKHLAEPIPSAMSCTIKLAQKALDERHAALYHLAQRQALAREARPLALEGDVEEAPYEARGGLADGGKVRHERVTLELEVANVNLLGFRAVHQGTSQINRGAQEG